MLSGIRAKHKANKTLLGRGWGGDLFHHHKCRSNSLRCKASITENPGLSLPESIMGTCSAVLAFESVDKIP